MLPEEDKGRGRKGQRRITSIGVITEVLVFPIPILAIRDNDREKLIKAKEEGRLRAADDGSVLCTYISVHSTVHVR